MVNNDGGTVRAVAWSEVCPWLNLFRCFRMAIRFRLLLLSSVAILLTVSGWAVLIILFSGDEEIGKALGPERDSPWLALPDLVWSACTDLVPDQPQLPDLSLGFVAERLGLDMAAEEPAPLDFQRAPEPFWGSFAQLSRPLRQVFASDVTGTKLALLLLCGLWTLVIWAYFGAAITRSVAVELASEERIPWSAMMRHARSKWRACLAAPLFPLLTVLVGAAIIGGLAGLLHWLVGINVAVFIVALFWPLVLLGGLLAAVLLLGLAFGWPLMWATIGAEGSDCFDALSRSYQYVFQRPLHYLFYALVAVLLGVLGWLVVSNFAAGVVALSYWAASWGLDGSHWLGGPGTASQPLPVFLSQNTEIGALGDFGAGLILFWCGCVKILAVGFLYSYFWTASTCIYFLLRRDADATEMDEVFLEEEEEEPGYGLPPIKTDEAGAPVVDDKTPPAPENSDLANEE